MKSFKRAFGKKVKSFRPTVVSMVLIVLATYRVFCSGGGIVICGVCASIVPFICQMRNYPAKDEESSDLTNILADYFVNLFYMLIYLAYMLLVTLLGTKLNPGYVQYTYFGETMLVAVSANMVFISVVYTIGAFLTWKQRMTIGIILVNALLGIMLLSESLFSVSTAHLPIFVFGNSVIIKGFFLTISLPRTEIRPEKRNSISSCSFEDSLFSFME